jgi:hypothetical protein
MKKTEAKKSRATVPLTDKISVPIFPKQDSKQRPPVSLNKIFFDLKSSKT